MKLKIIMIMETPPTSARVVYNNCRSRSNEAQTSVFLSIKTTKNRLQKFHPYYPESGSTIKNMLQTPHVVSYTLNDPGGVHVGNKNVSHLSCEIFQFFNGNVEYPSKNHLCFHLEIKQCEGDTGQGAYYKIRFGWIKRNTPYCPADRVGTNHLTVSGIPEFEGLVKGSAGQ